MQSANYVPGVSGWKICDEYLEFNGSPGGPVRFGDFPDDQHSASVKPYVIVDGVTYIRHAEIDKASVQGAKVGPEYSVKVGLLNGRHVAFGFGLGIASQLTVSADRFEVNGRDAGKILDDPADHISKTELCSSLSEQTGAIIQNITVQGSADDATLARIQQAAQKGAQDGYNLALRDLKLRPK